MSETVVMWLHPQLEGDNEQWMGTIVGVEGIKVGLKWPLQTDSFRPCWWLEARTDPSDDSKWAIVDGGEIEQGDLGKGLKSAESRLLTMLSDIMKMASKAQGGSA